MKFFKILLPAGVLCILFIAVSGFSFDNIEHPEKVKPNEFKQPDSKINLDDMYQDNKTAYHKISALQKKLTFAAPVSKDEMAKGLFRSPEKKQIVNVSDEVKEWHLFQNK